MAHSNVSSCVLSIVASFSNSLDLFRQLKEKRRRGKRTKNVAKLEENELRLGKSLRQGPEDIGREYQKSVQAAGDQFVFGDAIAHTSLAEILLNMNTGLVGIITSFLQDRKSVKVDYHSLTSLSERSRIDTCRALQQLYRRILQSRPAALSYSSLPLPQIAWQTRSRADSAGDKRQDSRPAQPVKSNKLHRPTIARITIENSSKPSQIALVKPAERRKRAGSSRTSSKAESMASGSSTPSPSPPPYETICTSDARAARPHATHWNSMPDVPKPRHMRSAAPVRGSPVPQQSEALRSTKSTSQLDARSAYKPTPGELDVPPLPSLPLTEIYQRSRKPTPTYYSITSEGTKLGEIPLHKWPTPFDFDAMSVMNHEAEGNGWPVNQAGSSPPRRKGFGLFRFFWK
ncbi:hypothetical protein BAUCODRAFT_359274 [Baudoinia panamericana UAMH 10762]|uniref:Uncharacterized protein n=1 Tax=Baudoinia panamericana (strain UAMH 10762) TaxID=717646 RepID=M2N7D7_BAUPA|nr:uncharacterized protein BAUCODRAFT_359274 [Baudoinia panamericana UAMH 10762]EMC99993.1 hypothetical protein BAUCODRAFT_359274 [Baudoinia panamericana UAMH 10762]